MPHPIEWCNLFAQKRGLINPFQATTVLRIYVYEKSSTCVIAISWLKHVDSLALMTVDTGIWSS